MSDCPDHAMSPQVPYVPRRVPVRGRSYLQTHPTCEAYDPMTTNGATYPSSGVGLSLDEGTFAILASTLSRVLGESTSEDGSSVSALAMALQMYAHTQMRRSGRNYPALNPELAIPTCSTGITVRKRLGLSLEQLLAQWQLAVARQGVDATFPAELLFAFFPPDLWPVLAAVLEDGPGLAIERSELLLKEYALRETRYGRRPSDGGLSGMAHPLRRVMNVFVELNQRGHSHANASLGQWTAVPKLKVPPGRRELKPTTAPPCWQMRRFWQDLSADVARRLNRPDMNECDAILDVPNSAVKRAGLFWPLRNRAVYAVLCCVGVRVGVVPRLQVQHYIPAYPLANGQVGPALITNPRKTLAIDEMRVKPIPAPLAALIDAYLTFVARALGRQLLPEEPLFVSTLTTLRPWTKGEIQKLVGRRMPRRGGGHYTPHNFRGGCVQMIASREGSALCAELGYDAHPISIGEALIDHKKMKLDVFGYFGASKPEDRERLAGYGSHVAWELLTSPLGARKVKDVTAFTAALHTRAALQAEIERTRSELRSARSVDVKDQAAVVAAFFEVQRLNDRKDDVIEELRLIEREIEAIRLNPKRMVAVADSEEDVPTADLDSVERQVLGGVEESERRRLTPVRSPPWLTFSELAYVLDAGEASVRRWAEGKLPRNPRKQPWSQENPPIDNAQGPKRRRVAVSGLNLALLDSDAKRQRLAETLSRLPEKWTREQAERPLHVGPPCDPPSRLEPHKGGLDLSGAENKPVPGA